MGWRRSRSSRTASPSGSTRATRCTRRCATARTSSSEDALLGDAAARPAAAEQVVRAVGCGLRRGEQRLGVVLRQILCCLDFAPQWSAECATLLQTVGREGGLVGIDVAAGEAHFAEGTQGQTRRAVRAAKPGPNPNADPNPSPSLKPYPSSDPSSNQP